MQETYFPPFFDLFRAQRAVFSDSGNGVGGQMLLVFHSLDPSLSQRLLELHMRSSSQKASIFHELFKSKVFFKVARHDIEDTKQYKNDSTSFWENYGRPL